MYKMNKFLTGIPAVYQKMNKFTHISLKHGGSGQADIIATSKMFTQDIVIFTSFMPW